MPGRALRAEGDIPGKHTKLSLFSHILLYILQRSYEQLRSTLEEREITLKEKEDSNYLLRKDLLEVMTQFNQEKVALERRLQEHRARGREVEGQLAEKCQEVTR